ncbi:MAG: TrpR-like protein YerC/YecD, partial [Clostridiales bacterium]|nr:TrpR-like protein YerC/YecD [Clostridiales bacterium]
GENYNTISKEVGVSTATISRVNRCLQYGADGYSRALDRMGITKPEKDK